MVVEGIAWVEGELKGAISCEFRSEELSGCPGEKATGRTPQLPTADVTLSPRPISQLFWASESEPLCALGAQPRASELGSESQLLSLWCALWVRGSVGCDQPCQYLGLLISSTRGRGLECVLGRRHQVGVDLGPQSPNSFQKKGHFCRRATTDRHLPVYPTVPYAQG